MGMKISAVSMYFALKNEVLSQIQLRQRWPAAVHYLHQMSAHELHHNY